ncbi:MAG: long-chain fatty acid--CoA ligase [Bacteroidota bacterium]
MEITRIFDLLSLFAGKYANKKDVFAKKEDGEWKKYSSSDYIKIVDHICAGLLDLGLEKGDKIATVFSVNRPEWNFIDMAILQVGMIHVPIYPTISEEDHNYILNHADIKVLFIYDKSLFRNLNPIIEKLSHIKYVYTIQEVEGTNNWNELIESGSISISKHINTIEEIKKSILPDDLATIIYTSGTTGVPKGVMLSHKNIVSNFKGAETIHDYNQNHRAISFLPLCHIFERTINYHFQYMGISIYYAENMGTIADNLKEIKPHLFITVPRLLESVYDKIIAKGKDLSGIKRSIFFNSVKLGLKFNYNKENSWWYYFRLKIADKLIFSKWREALGGNVRLIVIGGAALQPRLSRIFGAAGIHTLEVYGLTETSPVVSCNNNKTGEIKIGTVGVLFPDVQVKIDDEGEILVSGPNIMLGYYKDNEATNSVIDNDGWLHTGDIGMILDNKYLKITDRKKEIFKTSAGKYIAPQMIENRMKESIFIEQAMAVGEDEKFVSALISPNFRYLHDWCADRKIKYRDNKELIFIPRIVDLYQNEINTININLGQIEQIKRFRLVCEEWTPQSGELSPTLKLKRNVIYKKYDKILKEIYNYSPGEINRADKMNRK